MNEIRIVTDYKFCDMKPIDFVIGTFNGLVTCFSTIDIESLRTHKNKLLANLRLEYPSLKTIWTLNTPYCLKGYDDNFSSAYFTSVLCMNDYSEFRTHADTPDECDVPDMLVLKTS
jgi:hypothetical protein